MTKHDDNEEVDDDEEIDDDGENDDWSGSVDPRPVIRTYPDNDKIKDKHDDNEEGKNDDDDDKDDWAGRVDPRPVITILPFSRLCSRYHSIPLHCIMLYCVGLHYLALYCIFCNLLHCIISYYKFALQIVVHRLRYIFLLPFSWVCLYYHTIGFETIGGLS